MTRLTELLGIELPLVQAPMAGVSTPAMAAGVSIAGGLGSLGLGASGAEAARQAIAAVRAATNRPFNVNLFVHETPAREPNRERAWVERLAPAFAELGAEPPATLGVIYRSFNDDPDMLAMLADARPPVVSVHFGLPRPEAVAAVKDWGGRLIACATTVEEAVAAEAAGMDAVVAQGIEAGGHRGTFGAEDAAIGTMALVPQVREAVSIPVIAAGGIADGRGIAAAFALGADGVQLGTAFVGCPESAASAGYRRLLDDPRSAATAVTRAISGRRARAIVNRFVTRFGAFEGDAPAYPVAYDAGKALAAADRSGSAEYAATWAGQFVVRGRAMPAGELARRLIDEARAVAAALPAAF